MKKTRKKPEPSVEVFRFTAKVPQGRIKSLSDLSSWVEHMEDKGVPIWVRYWADGKAALYRGCQEHNTELEIELVPLGELKDVGNYHFKRSVLEAMADD